MATPTTTIRIPDELKARLARLAELEGTSTHSLILDAIAEKADALERRQSFHEEALQRLAEMQETGMGIEWDEMKRYLRARVAGEDVPMPLAKRIRD
jgi:predicted transcriptional regulator